MTVQNVQPAVVYTLTGISDYSFSFEVFETTDVVVAYADDVGSDPVTWVLNTDYTVTIDTDRTGYITVLDTAAEGQITISRYIPRTQEVAWVNNDPLDMVVQENSFDKLTMLIQELDLAYLTFPPGFPLGVAIPYPESEKILGWNTDADALANYPSYGSFQTLHDEAAASAAAAATSETNAAASETAAGTSETNAAASETAAGTSETNAAASETNAAASAAAAATSETNAAASAGAAATSETNAAASETAAATSETNAAASEASAEYYAGLCEGQVFDEWESALGVLRPLVDDNNDLGDSTHRPANIYVANDPTDDDHVTRLGYIKTVVGGFKNKIINGNFDIWQRGITLSGPLGENCLADRMSCSDGTDGTANLSQQSFVIGQTDVPGSPKYFLRYELASQATSGAPSFFQRIESVYTLSNESITFSLYLKCSSGTVTSTPYAKQHFGTGGSPSSDVYIYGSNLTITTDWQKFEIVFAIPSISGKTLGSSGGDHLQIGINFPLSATYIIDTAQWQVEKGSRATEFELRSIATELTLCERYYQRTYPLGVANGTILQGGSIMTYIDGLTSSDFYMNLSWLFRTQLRTTPTITLYSPNTGTSGYVAMPSGDVLPAAVYVSSTGIYVSATNGAASTTKYLSYHGVADAEL